MARILITADVHIHDFRNHNLFNNPRFRLEQFSKLAHRLTDIARYHDAGTVVIAGDFLHVASPRPYVVNTAMDFLRTLSIAGLHTYLTHGQHDYDSRTEMSPENTLLMLSSMIPRVRYVHREWVMIEDTLWYFHGWEPHWTENVQESLTAHPIYREADVLIGHTNPSNVKIGQYGMTLQDGSDIPSEMFRLAFLGDIHYHQARENWVIPGTPIQHSYNDDPYVGVLILDTVTWEWTRVPTIVEGEWDFLQLIISDDDAPISSPYLVRRPRTRRVYEQVSYELEKSLDVLKIIEDAVYVEDMQEVHAELYDPSMTHGHLLNLQFTLHHVEITNFRSIASLSWAIEPGVKLLRGSNGVGKTTLVDAILFALGQGDGRKMTRIGSDHMSVSLTLTYDGIEYTLVRGWRGSGYMSLSMNGTEVEAENQTALRARIHTSLPFLSMLDLMVHDQDRAGFLTSYNYAKRTELMSRVLGIDIVSHLHAMAHLRVQELDGELQTLAVSLASASALVENIKTTDFTPIVEWPALQELRRDLVATQDTLVVMARTHQDTLQKELLAKSTAQHSLTAVTRQIADLTRQHASLAARLCFTCGQPIPDTVAIQKQQDIKTTLRDLLRDQQVLQDTMDSIEIPDASEMMDLQEQMRKIATRLGEIDQSETHVVTLQRMQGQLEAALQRSIDLTNLHADVSTRRQAYVAYRTIMSPSGVVQKTLLTTVAELFSTDTLRVRTFRQLVNGEVRPDFTLDMRVREQFIAYDDLSGGQRTVADLMILEKLIHVAGGVGMLILDETMKYLDTENLELAIDCMRNLHSHATFVISHADSFPYYDQLIACSMDDNGQSHYMWR